MTLYYIQKVFRIDIVFGFAGDFCHVFFPLFTLFNNKIKWLTNENLKQIYCAIELFIQLNGSNEFLTRFEFYLGQCFENVCLRRLSQTKAPIEIKYCTVFSLTVRCHMGKRHTFQLIQISFHTNVWVRDSFGCKYWRQCMNKWAEGKWNRQMD